LAKLLYILFMVYFVLVANCNKISENSSKIAQENGL
jgi:hypothetical protein